MREEMKLMEKIKNMEIQKLSEQLKDLKDNGFKAQEEYEKQLLIIQKEAQKKLNELQHKSAAETEMVANKVKKELAQQYQQKLKEEVK